MCQGHAVIPAHSQPFSIHFTQGWPQTHSSAYLYSSHLNSQQTSTDSTWPLPPISLLTFDCVHLLWDSGSDPDASRLIWFACKCELVFQDMVGSRFQMCQLWSSSVVLLLLFFNVRSKNKCNWGNKQDVLKFILLSTMALEEPAQRPFGQNWVNRETDGEVEERREQVRKGGDGGTGAFDREGEWGGSEWFIVCRLHRHKDTIPFISTHTSLHTKSMKTKINSATSTYTLPESNSGPVMCTLCSLKHHHQPSNFDNFYDQKEITKQTIIIWI